MAKQLFEPKSSPLWVVVSAVYQCEVWTGVFTSNGEGRCWV